ncbi:uncharacterized protein [Rhodnius prolixus]|uniref:uncharacterized protein n=1 Tax=Rhodnius prolixus TaxID=13249 RepID=UPI003D1895C0
MDRDIIGEITSLDGENLGDIFKKFYLYLVANRDSLSTHKTHILDLFHPKDNLQKFFKLKLIDNWQNKQELVRLFADEDIFYTCQALKCKWFFTSVEINSSEFVNKFLPNLSYSTRLKVIKQYSKHLKDINIAEDIYIRVQQRYGTQSALTMLPACSPKFVGTALLNAHTQLKPAAIAPLFRRYPETVVNFFHYILECKATKKRVYRNFNLEKYAYVYVLIASKYPERFLDIYVNYNRYLPCTQLGNRTTKKIVKANASLIINNYKVFKNILKVKCLVRCMNSFQIEQLHAACFPDTVAQFFEEYWNFDELQQLTLHMKDDERQQILLRTFKKCYGKEFNVIDFAEVIDLRLMLSIPIEMRIKWILSKLSSIDNDSKKGEFLSYLPPDRALPALKKIIGRQEEMRTRAYLVKCMMLSVNRYNKSLNSILDCITFVLRRLRNDNEMIRQEVFSELVIMKEALLGLPSEQWDPIDELVDIVKMNEEIFNCKYYLQNVLSMKIQRYFAEGVPIEVHLKEYLYFQLSTDSYYDFELCKNTPHEKKCLEFFLSELQTLPCSDENLKRFRQKTLFISLCTYNLKHKNNPIKHPEWLLTSVEQLLLINEYNHWDKTSILSAICKDSYLKNRIYMKVFPRCINPDIATYILHIQPNKISEHKEAVMKEILNSYTSHEYIRLFKKITLYSKFGLPQEITKLCLSVLQTEEIESKGYYETISKPNAVTILSILMPVREFIHFIEQYRPIKAQLERYSDKNHLQYKIQKAIASSLKYVSRPVEILYFIKTFAVGDYLKLLVGTISSICLKVAEKNILPLLIQWLDCPVSSRKHFIRAYFKVAPISDAGKLVVSLLEKESNISLRHLLLKQMFKYFLAEPSKESFAIFKTGYGMLKSEDVAAIDDLYEIRIVPDSFVEPFIKLLWEVVEFQENSLVARNKKNVIDMICADIVGLLSEEFCDCLVEQVFSSPTLSEYISFITIYLVYGPDETTQLSRLQKVTSYLSVVIAEKWNEYNLNRPNVFQTRGAIFGLIESICQESLQRGQFKTTQLLEKLKLFVLSQILTADILDILLLLEISIFITKNDRESETFVLDVAKFYEELLVENSKSYGDQIITTVVSQMPYCLAKSKHQIAKVLLSKHTSYQAHLMAIELVGTDINHDLPMYKFFVDYLLSCSQPYVKTAAGKFLRNLNSSILV